LIDVALGKALSNQLLLFSPLYRFRYASLILRKRKPIYYVADSVLKTSVHAWFNRPWLVQRIMYAFLVEKIIQSSEIIVASLDESMWFSSIGHPVENITFLPPIPSSSVCQVGLNEAKYDILFYNPRGGGIELTQKIMSELGKIKCNYEIAVTGRNASVIASAISLKGLKVHFFDFVDDIDALICSSNVVVLTDIGGSGLCNRSMQVRYLGSKLVATPDSVRGTTLFLDDGVRLFRDQDEAVEVISQVSKEVEKVTSPQSLDIMKLFGRGIDRIIKRCYTRLAGY
jgi:hypothetical protein